MDCCWSFNPPAPGDYVLVYFLDVMMSSPKFFPPAEAADSQGLVCIGGELSPEWLLDAYRHGIFPWPAFDDLLPAGQDLLLWWSPNPRAILELDEFHVSRRLARTLGSGRFEVTCDHDFQGVLEGCATAQDRRHNTWITPEMIDAYTQMHALGHAHSVEVWHADQLVGGIYGIAIGAMFAGESMFYLQRDASKIALVHLVRHLKARGYELLDIQQLTAHAEQMGAREIPRKEFLKRLDHAQDQPVSFGMFQKSS